MKITLFTSNNSRHIYLIKSLLKVCKCLNVVIESKTIFNGKVDGYYKKNKIISNYFRKVEKAQIKYFKNNYIPNTSKKINILPISMGDLNYLNLNNLKNFLSSDIYIVFGSSYIKGKLVDFLIKKKQLIFIWVYLHTTGVLTATFGLYKIINLNSSVQQFTIYQKV